MGDAIARTAMAAFAGILDVPVRAQQHRQPIGGPIAARSLGDQAGFYTASTSPCFGMLGEDAQSGIGNPDIPIKQDT